MKKIIFLLFSLFLLSGCGATKMNGKKYLFITILSFSVLMNSGCAFNPASGMYTQLRDRNYDAVVKYLSEGHDVNELLTDDKGNKITLLAKAVNGNSLKLAKYLVRKGAVNINREYKVENSNSYTLLTSAVRRGNAEMVNYLISIGADVNKELTRGFNAIEIATSDFFLDKTFHTILNDKDKDKIGVEMTDILMKAGADINITRALLIAADDNRDKVLEYLFQNFKINPNVRDSWKKTPLHEAAEFTAVTGGDNYRNGFSNMNKEMIQKAKKTISILLKYGADPILKDDKGKTAQDLFNESIAGVSKANYDYANKKESGFQWGKFAALTTGAVIGGVNNLQSDQQVSLLGAMVKDSAADVDGASNTFNYTNSQIEKLKAKNGTSSSYQQSNKNSAATVKSGSSCSKYAGSYLEGGIWKTHYTLNRDCTGSYCMQVLNNPEIPTSGYGWYCNEGRGNKKISNWKKANGNILITFSSGESISRPASYLKKK